MKEEISNKNMKAVILARVSTQEQTQGESINGQTDRLLEYCKRKNLQIIKSFSIVESSTKGDRKEFQEVIEFIKQQKQEIALVVEAVDRIQRGFKESVLLSDMIQLGQVCLHFNKENLVINQNSNPSEILRWDFSVLGAKSYALDISHNTKRSLLTKLQKGELTRIAPIGYLNIKDEQGKSKIIVDKSRAFLVKEMFEMY
jgi:site-specific DNA recombinase